MSHVKGRRDSERGVPLQSVEHHWIGVFKKYDHDNDGRISLQELYREVNSPEFQHDIPEQAIHNIFKQYDVNDDGYINFDEFLHLLESDFGGHLLRHALNKYIRNTIVPRRLKKVRAHADITDGEYEDEYTCMPPPICMLFITAAEIAAFLYDFSFFSSNSEATIIGPAGQLFYYRPDRREQFWRFLTYMFVHANVSHLVVNIVVQLMLGIPLEMVHRWWRVLIIYLAGVIAGSLGTSVSDPEVALVGASGGVYALIAAHLSTIILNWSEMEYAGWQLAVFLSLTVVDCGQAVYARYFSNEDLKIGYVAHLTGALAGLLVGLYVLRNLQVHSWEEKVKWIGFSLYVILIALAIFYNFRYS